MQKNNFAEYISSNISFSESVKLIISSNNFDPALLSENQDNDTSTKNHKLVLEGELSGCTLRHPHQLIFILDLSSRVAMDIHNPLVYDFLRPGESKNDAVVKFNEELLLGMWVGSNVL